MEEILDWYCVFDEPNLAIITGQISGLVVIDLDELLILEELKKQLPGVWETTRVRTKRGYHFYFSDTNINGNGINSTNNFLNLKIELRYNGMYSVAPPSTVADFPYHFEVPLSKMLAFPKTILRKLEKKEGEHAINTKYKSQKILKLPKFYTLGAACIEKITNRNLQVGERDSGLFILYNLLLQNKNTEDHSKKITNLVNDSLTKPLTEKEVKNIFRKTYHFQCSTIREKLPFINCSDCKYKFRGGKSGKKNIITQNLKSLDKLTPSEQRVLLFLGSYFEGEKPSITALSNKIPMNFNTAKKAVAGLKNKGIIK